MSEHDNEFLQAMADQVAGLHGVDVDDKTIEIVLTTLTEGAVNAIPGAAYAGITVVENGEVMSVALTDGVAATVDVLQAKHQIGPCLAAAWEQQTIHIDDYRTEPRWPEFVRDILEYTPVRSSLAIQLHRDASSMSALNLHSDLTHAFDDDAHALARVFAVQAALAMRLGAKQIQFDQALASRDDIGQAKGILMERYAVDADQAFAMLRAISQDSNVKVAELARRLIELDHPKK